MPSSRGPSQARDQTQVYLILYHLNHQGNLCIYMCVCVCMYVYVYIYMYVCIYIYMYVYV